MRSALLLGRDHGVVGELAAVAEGNAAIALSCGGARKTYGHTEPNEDAALFAIGPAGELAAVADGHDGAGGSQAVVELLAQRFAADWTATAPPFEDEAGWREQLETALLACNRAVLAEAATLRPPAPTTLALALVRRGPGEGDGLLAWASVGDSHVFRAGHDAAEELSRGTPAQRRSRFLGYQAENPLSIREKYAAGCIALDDVRAVVLASDGLSETGIGVADPAAAVHRAVDDAVGAVPGQRALRAAKTLARAAMRAQREQQAGDNVASAVLWLGDA